MNGINLPLIERVLVQIERNRASWGQSSWGHFIGDPNEALPDAIHDEEGRYIGLGTCNTAQCVAGWTLTLSDVKMRWFQPGRAGDWYAEETEDGRPIDREAWERLGIEPHLCCDEWDNSDADSEEGHACLWDHTENFPLLFSADNGLDTIYAWVAEYAGIDQEELEGRVARRALLGDEVKS